MGGVDSYMSVFLRFKYTAIVLMLPLLLTGCLENTSYQQPIEAKLEQKTSNIEIDVSELEVNEEGIELLGVELEESGRIYIIIASIKNNTNYKYDNMVVHVKLYDQDGALLKTDLDSMWDVDAGETWKTNILVTDSAKVAKIKITEIITRGPEGSSGTVNNDTLDDKVIGAAKTLVYKNIKAPATAQWVSAETIDKDNYGRHLVNVVIDAENSFGALIRTNFIVAIQSIKEDGSFTYSNMFFMKEYDTESKKEQAIEYIRNVNKWNEDEKAKEDEKKESDDSKKVNTPQKEFMSEEEIYNIVFDLEEVFKIDIPVISADIVTYPTAENPIYEVKVYEDFEDHIATYNYFTLDATTGELLSVMFEDEN